MSNWMWIGVGLVIIGDVGWLAASLVTGCRRRRKGPEETKSASARQDQHQQEVRVECAKSALHNCTGEATQGDVHADGGAHDPSVVGEVPG